MTYFGFLLRFLGIPILLLLILLLRDEQKGGRALGFKNGRATLIAISIHVGLALIYTTPWDNYLVATGVWFYDKRLVSGIVLGWVPLEEYVFFILETILVGQWGWFIIHRVNASGTFKPSAALRIGGSIMLSALWIASAVVLFSGGKPWTYLAITLFWVLPAIVPQLAFGADILWHHRKPIALTILPLTIYLCLADALAIASGTWTIDPAQTTGIFLGALPVEEAVFFFVTVTLVTFGMTLILSQDGRERMRQIVRFYSAPRK
jgi:lycopene cyclase domain-containing protein